MPRLSVSAQLTYEVRQPTVFLFNVCAERSSGQRIVREAFKTDPTVPLEPCQVGIEGCRLHRAQVAPCQFRFGYEAEVTTADAPPPDEDTPETPVALLPAEILTYLYPSRYCESDLLARFASEEFAALDRNISRIKAISDWVSNHLDYVPGSSDSSTTASNVLIGREGVCRDYAHLAIACCRAVGVPARYVAAYAVGVQPPDFHGLFEAYVGGRWWAFDPTGMADPAAVARIGVGRDAADVAFASITGHALLTGKSVSARFED